MGISEAGNVWKERELKSAQLGGKDMARKIKFTAAYAVMNAPHAQGIFPSAELVASQGTPMLSAPSACLTSI